MENATRTFRGPDFEQLSAIDPEITGEVAELAAAFPAYHRG
ncbi:hypothetical protein ACH4OY_26715 [Micromonospora rubida]|uniref:Uncharacterized protein n=1 Tax=Micromonospora rubida TaxID=2697657 RepID=A0ABW7SRD3_9ACTN